MTREENTQASPAPSFTCGCEPSAMRDNAARGSPWLPVQRNSTSFSGMAAACCSDRNSRTPSSRPTDLAAAAIRCIERPTRQTPRPAASAARITLSMRATFEAKHATATLPVRPPIRPASASFTSASEPDSPSTKTLVESHTMARTPSSPSFWIAASSVTEPSTGSGSIFQSPVCSTVPSGVRIARPFGSGIECVSVISSTSNGPSWIVPLSGTSVISASAHSSFSRSFSRRRKAVNGVAYSGARSCGHSHATAPMWSSWAWVSTMPTMFLAYSRMNSGSGRMISTPGVVWSPKVTPRSTTIHLRACAGP